MISDFKKEAKRRANAQQDLFSHISDNLAVISQQDEEVTDLQDELHTIEGKLSGGDVRSKVRAINSEIQLCDKVIRESGAEKDRILLRKGGYESKAERADTERRNLTLLDDKNKKIEIYKAYAERIYQELLEVYATSEAEIRSKLETTIIRSVSVITSHLYNAGDEGKNYRDALSGGCFDIPIIVICIYRNMIFLING